MKTLLTFIIAMLTLGLLLPAHAVIVLKTTPTPIYYTGGGYRCYPSGWCGRVEPGYYHGHNVDWYSYHRFYNPKFVNGSYVVTPGITPMIPARIDVRN